MHIKNLPFTILIAATVSILLSALPAYALLVGFGQYAGTHTVIFDPEPRSPFVGETVKMRFYLHNLQGLLDKEPFDMNAEIQKVSSHNVYGVDDVETTLFVTKYETITGGIYETSYIFTQSGAYRVVFNFGIPDNPDIIRDAVFDIEVRDLPQDASSNTLWIAVFFPIVILAFAGGVMIGRSRSRRKRSGDTTSLKD